MTPRHDKLWRSRCTWIAATLAAAVLGPTLRAQKTGGIYSLIRDEARTFQLKEARGSLSAGRSAEAIELLLGILRCSPSAVARGRADSYVGLREAARLDLANLPTKARALYETLVANEVGPRLTDATQRGDIAALTRLALRFPHTTPTVHARVVVGDRFLERGRVLRALQHYALAGYGERASIELNARRLLCRVLLGLEIHPENVTGDGVWPLGTEKLSKSEWLGRIEKLHGAGYPPALWPAFGGGLDGTRLAQEPVDARERHWSESILDLDPARRAAPLNMHAVADGRRVFVSTGMKLYAFDLLTGDAKKSWTSPSYMEDIEDLQQRDQYTVSLSPHQVHAAALGKDTVVASLQVPVAPEVAKENQRFNHIPIMRRLPVRRLHAFEKESGKLIWSHYEPGRAHTSLKSAALDVSGPPLVVDDTVYVPTQSQLGTIAFYLSAFDLRTGALRWQTLICSSQTEVNMFGNVFQEFAAGPLAYDNGMLYGTTNLGLAYSIRADDGAIRWLQGYPIIPIPPARMRELLRRLYWANNAPVVSNGRVVLTPIDSEDALCLDTKTGTVVWRLHHRVGDPTHPRRRYELRWLLGVRDGEAWFSGQCIVARPLGRGAPRIVATPLELGQSNEGDHPLRIPRPLLTQNGLIYLSSTGGLMELDKEGRPRVEERRVLDEEEVGNLCCSNGVLVSVRPRSVHAYYSLSRLLSRARNDAQRHPADPKPALAYAELLAARPNPDLTTEGLRKSTHMFRRVLGLCEKSGRGGSSPLCLRAKAGLFHRLTALGGAQELSKPEAAKASRREAMALGRELYAGGVLLERDLIRFYLALLRAYEFDEPELRDEILTHLEQEHGTTFYGFSGGRRTSVGLFVLLQRLRAAPADRVPGRRLALLRRILVEHSGDEIPQRDASPVRGREFAMREITRLLKQRGRKVYAPFEQEASALLTSAQEDPSRLRLILEQYPCSQTAMTALVRLAVVAADRGELAETLRAYAFAAQRLPKLPTELRDAVARAAGAAGNLRLAASLDQSRPRPGEILVLEERLASAPTEQLQHSTGLSTSKFPKTLTPTRISGFVDRAGPHDAKLPLLLLRNPSLYAFLPKDLRPSTGNAAPSLEARRPDYRKFYDPPFGRLDAVLCGTTLVLPGERSVRGISLVDGELLWTLHANPDSEADASQTFVLGGALASGLYVVCRAAVDFSKRSSIEVLGIEPLTGIEIFRRRLQADRPPSLSNGWLFQHREHGDATRLVLLDGLTGKDSDFIELGGRGRPQISMYASRHVLVTATEVFLLAPIEAAAEATDAGLYCFARRRSATQRSGSQRWHLRTDKLRDRDNFLVSGSEVLLTVGFDLPSLGRMYRIDRDSGRVRRKIACGYNAQLPRFPYGVDATIQEAGPLLVVGEDEHRFARLTLLNSRPGSESWSIKLSHEQLSLPLADDFPRPLYSDHYLVLSQPIERGRGRYLNVFLFDLQSGRLRPAPALRMKPWHEPSHVAAWNGFLVIRSAGNGWVFGGMIKRAPAGVQQGSRGSGKGLPGGKRR